LNSRKEISWGHGSRGRALPRRCKVLSSDSWTTLQPKKEKEDTKLTEIKYKIINCSYVKNQLERLLAL
jgi:hypothetical protein